MAKTNPPTTNDFRIEPILPVDVKRATLVAFFAWVFAVYDFILFGTLLPEIGAHYKWTPTQQAEIATLVAAGQLSSRSSLAPCWTRRVERAVFYLPWPVPPYALALQLSVARLGSGLW